MIKIELESNTVAEMTETLKSLLAALTGATPILATAEATPAKPAPKVNWADKPATPARPAPKAPAAKPEPKPEPEPEPKPEPEETPETPEDEEAPEDDVLGGSDEGEGMTPEQARDEATARAQKLVGEGKSSAVRAALDSVKKGAKVSTLSDIEVFAFLKALG